MPLTRHSSFTHPEASRAEPSSVTEVSKGILFVYALADGEVDSYVCTDPIFDGVRGHQTTNDFITGEMISAMRKKLDIEDKDGVYMSRYDISQLLYNFTQFMQPCDEDGQTFEASFVVSYRD